MPTSELWVDGRVVIFTDGFDPTPEDRDADQQVKARIGAVMFHRELARPVTFTMPVEQEMIDRWIPRTTQISMIEMLAPIVAVETFAHLIQGKKIVMLIDSESALGALVKGYSAREDLCELTSVFWEQVSDLEGLVFLDRVSTDANISDGPSRGDLSVARSLGWVITEPLVPRML